MGIGYHQHDYRYRHGHHGHYHHYQHHHRHFFDGKGALIVALVAALAVVLFITIRKNKKYRLEKKKATISKVLVTGGCEGIGKEIALQFAKHLNCQIIIFDQHNEHVDDLSKGII